MKNKKGILIVILAFCLSVSLGMMDYETESLIQLFTSDFGNVITMVICTLVFSLMGWGILRLVEVDGNA